MIKEKMLEKIREKVILANNPRCKTYEEALEEEIKNSSSSVKCQFVLTDNDDCVVNDDYIAKYYHHNNNYKILGLPLNLERVLVALKIANEKRLKNDISFLQEVTKYNDLDNVAQIKEWMFNQKNETFPFICFQTAFEEWVITTGENQGIISWQPNKTLEEQSEETIKAIYDILCND